MSVRARDALGQTPGPLGRERARPARAMAGRSWGAPGGTPKVNGCALLNASQPAPGGEEARSRPSWLASTLAFILIFTIVVDILGNALVILSVYRNRKLRNAGRGARSRHLDPQPGPHRPQALLQALGVQGLLLRSAVLCLKTYKHPTYTPDTHAHTHPKRKPLQARTHTSNMHTYAKHTRTPPNTQMLTSTLNPSYKRTTNTHTHTRAHKHTRTHRGALGLTLGSQPAPCPLWPSP